jgi:hypothetical protein
MTYLPTILVSLPYGMSARNILRSQIFHILREGTRIILLTPLHGDPNFRKEFESPGVVIRDLPRSFPILFKAFRYLVDIVESYAFTRETKRETLMILQESLKKDYPLIYFFRIAIGATLGRSKTVLKIMRNLQWKFLSHAYYEALFNEFSPDLVFLTHPLALEEFPLAYYAKRRKVPIVAMIHSWDNITAKSGLRTVTSTKPGRMMPFTFEKVIVWNKIMQEELVTFYNYDPRDILIAGVPQFDYYCNGATDGRERFFKKIGAAPQKKLITYAAGSPFLLPKQDEVIQALVDALLTNRFALPVQILIRSHPGTDMQWVRKKFGSIPDVIFDQATVAYSANPFTTGWKADDEDKGHLAEILRYSDVVINVASTMSIDTAIFDKPIICVAFDGKNDFPYHKSIRKHYDFTHYKPIVESDGVSMVRSADELINAINAYLLNPSMRREGRRKIVQELCGQVDGKAGERVGHFILDILYHNSKEYVCNTEMVSRSNVQIV